MKTTIARKGICYILIFCLLFPLVGCEKKCDSPILNQDLVVEEVEVVYDAVEMTSYTARLRSLYIRAAKLLTPSLQEEENAEQTKAYIRNEILPMLQRLRISQYELDQLLSFAQTLCKTAEKSGLSVAAKMLEASYQNCISVLGSQRAGRLLYHGSLLYVIHKRNENGDSDPVYGEIFSLLTEVLTEDAFASAAAFTYYTTSLLEVIPQQNKLESPVQLTYEELRLLLVRQADSYKEYDLTAEQWRAAGKVFGFLGIFNFINTDKLGDLSLGIWQIICQEGVLLPEIFATVPTLASLYAALANELTEKEMEQLASQDENRYIALFTALARIQTPFLEYVECVSLAISSVEDGKQAEYLQNIGLWQAFLAYRQERSEVDAKELVAGIVGNAHDPGTIGLYLENYLFSILPYFTFCIYYERSVTP